MAPKRKSSKKRVGTRRVARTTKASKIAYKKCIVNAIKKAKISTPKMATRAFRAAAKKCRKACLEQRVCSSKTGKPLKVSAVRKQTTKKATSVKGKIRVRKPGGGFYYRKRPSKR